jgi:hypothetical protein
MEHMRARHEVFGVKDVPRTRHYLDNGWTEVDPATPLTVDEQRKAINDARRGTLTDRPAAEVVEALAVLPEEEKAAVVADEKAGKARKTVLKADED